MSGAPLTFRDVAMRFPNGTVALDDVNLSIRPGEFVALLGPSGCGKSTLLRLASGLDQATSGRTETGTDRIGYVFQDATLLPWLNVERNVALFGELDRLPAAELSSRVANALDMVGLSKFAKHLPHQLSGGMRMRTSLARSLVNNPALFLFDEPFGALDEFTREKLNDDVRALWLEDRFTSVFVTHSIAEAVYMATRVVVMGASPGRIIGEYEVPFGDERDEHTRYSPNSPRLSGEISDLLKGRLYDQHQYDEPRHAGSRHHRDGHHAAREPVNEHPHETRWNERPWRKEQEHEACPWKSVLLPVAFAAGVLALWYITSAFLLSPSKRFILPMPHEILVVAFLDPSNVSDLLRQLGTTAVVAMTGLAIAAVIGITTAILMSQAKWVETTLYPYAVALQSVPILALVPLIAFALGYGFGSRILVVILISLFPIVTNTLFGLHSANAQMKDLFRLKRASRWTLLWRLQFPAALPALFTGLRISAGMAVVGAIVADFFFRQGNSGIGLAIDTYRNRLDGEMLYGAILVASFFGLAVFWLFGVLSRLVVGKWYQPESR